jgi:rhodanese-related sulfurtransferase
VSPDFRPGLLVLFTFFDITTFDMTTLLGVRTPKEFADGHLPGAVNIPVDDLRGRLGELSKDRQILAYCQVGMRGSIATRILLQRGFSVANLGGGYKTFLLLRAARGS